MGQSESNNIYSEIATKHGSGISIWLEGWDELDGSFVHHSVFEDQLLGRVLPNTTVVVTTRPLASY